jgi:hypothetical protein
MRRIVLMLMVLCLFASTALAARAHQEDVTADRNLRWEARMQPQETTAEKEAARWSIILENDFGIYAYDMDSLGYDPVKDVAVGTVKTLFTNKDVVKKLQKTYAARLPKGEKVGYCTLQMLYKLKDKTYAVKQMDVFSQKGTLLEHKVKKVEFIPVPPKTFAEAMLEVEQAFVQDLENQKSQEDGAVSAK